MREDLPASSSEIVEETTPSPAKRRLLWICAIVGLLLLLILTPPLLNVNRLQRRIAASMSASLGRTVHLDSVTLHLVPVPGFTLENLVVSEDPAFGSEPVIRANTVEVTLRPSSLWRRHVEFSSVKFDEPSLNLVRNAQGEWNVQSLLMHAASVNTAPTAQKRAGPEPRFPYIEATGARVNLKLGEEKKPFSLTDADFALWLPSPQVWRVRLEGQPARTDMNISDPGTVKLEGSLGRAATMAEVPVDLTASWDGAPLGEASKLLTGNDAGWRGNLAVEATLVGRLGTAKLTTRMHFDELRRADFVPVETMDVHAVCNGTLDVTTAVLSDTDCSLRAPEDSAASGRVVASADSVDLTTLSASGLRVGLTDIPNAWLLDWVRLFSQRIPADERPGGAISGNVALAPVQDAAGDAAGNIPGHNNLSKHNGAAASWQGEFHGELVGALPWKPKEPPSTVHLLSISTLSGSTAGLVLAPVSLTAPGKMPPLTLSGSATAAGYTLHLMGTAAEAQLVALRSLLPPVGDAVREALPTETPEASAQGVAPKPVGIAPKIEGIASKTMKVDLTCSRLWGSAQTCSASVPVTPKRKHRRR